MNSTESTIRLIFTRLVAKKRLHISRFVGFSFVFLVLTAVGGVFLCTIYTGGHNGRDVLTNDERRRKNKKKQQQQKTVGSHHMQQGMGRNDIPCTNKTKEESKLAAKLSSCLQTTSQKRCPSMRKEEKKVVE